MQYILPVVLIILIGRRIFRSIGFQKYSKGRLIFRVSLVSLVAIILLTTAAFHPVSYLFDFIGMVLGAALLYWATRQTTFENRGTDLYYRTNIWIELIVVGLFLGRLVTRIPSFIGILNSKAETPEQMRAKMESLRDPYTGALIFILFVFYIGYSAYILKKAPHALNPVQQEHV
ncbi:MAG: sporulation protein [Bacteroidia bacterium]